MNASRDYILMVEDNDDDVVLTLRSFEKNNFPYQVVVARDGAEALTHLLGIDGQGQRLHKNPMMVLLDLNLPKVLGLEVLKALRTDPLLKGVPVVILSSSYEKKDRADAEQWGANLYIRKPINFRDLDEVARQIQDFLAAQIPSPRT